MRYFTFNNVRSDSMNIRAIRTSRVIIPTSKREILSIPESNTLYVIPDSSFNPITITVECLVYLANGETIHNYGRRLRQWLTTEGTRNLVFSDDPTYSYNAILNNEIVINDVRDVTKNVIVLEFLCEANGV